MRNREQLINLRILHVVIMLITAIFIYQYSQWDDALWIPISVLAITGPFYPGLVVNKAYQRVLGSIAGLLLSLLVWLIICYNYNLLVIIAVVLVYLLAFSSLQEYTYFIMILSILLCINFDYMNLFFNNEITYVINRIICVLTGVAICLACEYLIFRKIYTSSVWLIDCVKLDLLISNANNVILSTQTSLSQLNNLIFDLNTELEQLNQLRHSYLKRFNSQEQTLKVIAKYKDELTLVYKQLTNNGWLLLNQQQQ